MPLYIILSNSNSCFACKSAFLQEEPLCFPDFNPIERTFSKCKAWLCTIKVRTCQVLEEAIWKIAE